MKTKVLFILNGSKALHAPVTLPILKKHNTLDKPTLSVLIDSPEAIECCNDPAITLYFQLPNSFKAEPFIALFKENRALIPWFPSVLIGEDYLAAVELLEQLQPKYIVTNNTGIAFEAHKNGISWIAGPFLNITNSYSLLCLKENFNCSGAFLSNEIKKQQIRGIKKPENFKLFYSIYHPIVLMTSRQCLFHQVSGCEKNRLDESCIQQCEKVATLTNLKKDNFSIQKSKGNYHTIYSAANYLNTAVITDFPNLFSGFMIDLRDIKTDTKTTLDSASLIDLFKNHLNAGVDSGEQLKQAIFPTSSIQYEQGI